MKEFCLVGESQGDIFFILLHYLLKKKIEEK